MYASGALYLVGTPLGLGSGLRCAGRDDAVPAVAAGSIPSRAVHLVTIAAARRFTPSVIAASLTSPYPRRRAGGPLLRARCTRTPYTPTESFAAVAMTSFSSADLRPLARRYLGADGGDAYIASTHDEHLDNVVVRMRPERWLTVDFAKANGASPREVHDGEGDRSGAAPEAASSVSPRVPAERLSVALVRRDFFMARAVSPPPEATPPAMSTAVAMHTGHMVISLPLARSCRLALVLAVAAPPHMRPLGARSNPLVICHEIQ